MNARAAQIGCTHTHFVNPHGLHDDAHYTSARDLAMIARVAMQEPRICEVVATRHSRIARSMDKDDVSLKNHSHFLGKFPGADGIKTGYTKPAGHCYVGSATYGGWRLISVVLKSPDYVGETSALMKYGFHNYEPHVMARPNTPLSTCRVVNGEAESVTAVAKRRVQYVTRRGETLPCTAQASLAPLTAPVVAGSPIGTMQLTLNGMVIQSVPLVAGSTVLANPPSLLSRSEHSRGGHFFFGAVVFVFVVSLWYGTRNRIRISTPAKSPRRRRRRFPSGL